MKVTGYQLREALKSWELRKDAAERVLGDSLKVFPGEEKPHPKDLIQQVEDAEIAIAKLQVAQMEFNLAVMIQFEDAPISLALAVKSLGGYTRIEKHWRTTAGEKATSTYGYRGEDERDPEKQYSKHQVSPMEAAEKSMACAKRAGALRAAIAVGNAREQQINVDPQLFS